MPRNETEENSASMGTGTDKEDLPLNRLCCWDVVEEAVFVADRVMRDSLLLWLRFGVALKEYRRAGVEVVEKDSHVVDGRWMLN